MQELSFFTDGSGLKLTIAGWFTPKLRSIEKQGIEPDFPAKDDFATATIDEGLEEAIRILLQQ